VGKKEEIAFSSGETMMTVKDIFNFYQSNEFNPILPYKVTNRHFRFKLENKNFRKVPDRIHNKDELVKWIFKLGGVDLYHSTSLWLNPVKISTKGTSGTYHIADNLLIRNDLVFDIDAEEPITMEGLELAKKSAQLIRKYMKQFPEFVFSYFACSGYKGFRLYYIDNTQLPVDPRFRLDFIEKNRKLFIDKMLQSNKQIFFDKEFIVNPLAIVRVPGSVHSTTGYISSILPLSLLSKSVEEILTHVPYLGKERPVIPQCGEMIQKATEISSPRPRLLQCATDVSGLASLHFNPENYRYFFSNRVLGIRKGFIPIFIYQDIQKNYKTQAIELQQKYNLGPLYIFKFENKTVVISLKTMQRRQLQKILNESTSKTKHDFKKYNRIFAPLPMLFIEKIPYKYTGNLSRGHFYYVEPSKMPRANVYVGWEQIELIRAKTGHTNGK
jgi:hypothetical protein